ncbi:MAG TPA: hypothetical protein VG227_09755 [Caulobacteraceae bacterium]|nr:hypothetical protein [Caulobacteraceae bacterium]
MARGETLGMHGSEFLTISFVAILLCGATGETHQPIGGAHVVISGNGDLNIPADRLKAVQESALKGSGAAAHRLAMYYTYVKSDHVSGTHWETIAAENGSPIAMSSLGTRLEIERKSPDDDIRARFWLERAKAAGNVTAKKKLEVLNGEARKSGVGTPN